MRLYCRIKSPLCHAGTKCVRLIKIYMVPFACTLALSEPCNSCIILQNSVILRNSAGFVCKALLCCKALLLLLLWLLLSLLFLLLFSTSKLLQRCRLGLIRTGSVAERVPQALRHKHEVQACVYVCAVNAKLTRVHICYTLYIRGTEKAHKPGSSASAHVFMVVEAEELSILSTNPPTPPGLFLALVRLRWKVCTHRRKKSTCLPSAVMFSYGPTNAIRI